MKSSVLRISISVLLGVILPAVLLAQPATRERAQSGSEERPIGSAADSPNDYVLQPQDLLRVHVFQEEDINKQGEVSISNDYSITLPLIGTINLRGKTQRQAEELIRQLYDKDYLVNPTVTVQVLKYSDRSVNVTGAVNRAGRVQFPQEKGLTITDAITLADGQSRLADLKRVKLTRRNAAGEPEAREVNVDAIIKGGARDVSLQVGDTIFVPERIL
jgi:polysaccharide export outer membrane protein